MLIILIHNDGTAGENGKANYDVEVRVNQKVIKTLRVEGHFRQSGWIQLLRRVVEEAEKK